MAARRSRPTRPPPLPPSLPTGTRAAAGAELRGLQVLLVCVRGCGGGRAEWEERCRSVPGSRAGSLPLPARPAGWPSLAEAGARAAYNSPPVDPEDQRRILAAITRAAAKTPEATIPAQQSLAGTPARAPRGDGAGEWRAPATAAQELAAPGVAVP